MHDQDPSWFIWVKTGVAWALMSISSLTASQVATWMTITFTAINIYVTVRDKLMRDNGDEK